MPICEFLNILSEEYEDMLTVEKAVLSHYISLKNQEEIDEESVQRIIKYFGQKLQMYEAMEKHLLTEYTDEEV